MEPGGLWDADRYEIKALLARDGEPAGEMALAFTGAVSQFEGVANIDRPGTYVVTVYAYDPVTGNTGLDRTTFMID